MFVETSIDSMAKQRGRKILTSINVFFPFLLLHTIYVVTCQTNYISSHKIWNWRRIKSVDFNFKFWRILKWFILDFNPWCPHDSLKPIKESMKYLSKILKQLNSLFSVCLCVTIQMLYWCWVAISCILACSGYIIKLSSYMPRSKEMLIHVF